MLNDPVDFSLRGSVFRWFFGQRLLDRLATPEILLVVITF
jgi:hypothetical protein